MIARNFRWLLIIQVFALVLASAPAAAAPITQSVMPPAASSQGAASSYEYDACKRASNKNVLREEIAHLIRVTLENPEAPLDIDALVAKAWEESLINDVIDREVDTIIEDLLENEPWRLLAASAWMPPVAEAYANRVVKELFSSKAFTTKVGALSKLVAADLSAKMTAEFDHAASVGLLCLQEFAQNNYSSDLFAKALDETVNNLAASGVQPTPLTQKSLERIHSVGLGGIAVLLMTYLLSRLAREIGEKIVERIGGKIVERILGKGASSLIPVAGWVIGVGMLVYDLWESGKGALPQIREALKSEEAKGAIRSEIVEAIQESLPDQVDSVAYQIAVTLVDQWEHFCTEYGGLCQLKDENPTFAVLMGKSSLTELDTIRDLVTFYREELGEKELIAAIDSYNFDEILKRVLAHKTSQPENTPASPHDPKDDFMRIPIIRMLREVHSTTVSLTWVTLAGEKLDRLVFLNVHRYTSPEEWEQEQLAFVLALPKSRDIERVLSLPIENRTILFSLSSDGIQTLVTTCSVDNLNRLTEQMLQPGNRPQTIAQEAVDCQWEGPIVVLPSAQPTAAPSPQPTRASVAPTPVTRLATAQSTLQWLDDLKKLPINTDWSMLAFVFFGLFLEISFFSRRLAQSDRKQKEEQLSKDQE